MAREDRNISPSLAAAIDLIGERDTFARLTRVAKGLLDASFSDVVFVHDRHVWRSHDGMNASEGAAPLVRAAMDAGHVIWVEDGHDNEAVLAKLEALNATHIRFCAAAPIALADGVPFGALTVFNTTPRAYDKNLAHRLQDLAQLAGDACQREYERQALAKAERRLSMALDLADIHVWELDFVQKTLEKAGAGASLFDHPISYEDLRANVHCTIHPDDVAGVQAAYAARGPGEAPTSTEHRVRRADGQEVWASSVFRVRLGEDHRPIGVIGAMQNITARKRTEQSLVQARDDAQAANRAKSEFLAAMSHEIRTPLNGVLGMAQAMANDELKPEQRERLKVIRRSGETLLAVLNDILDLSKIEAGKLELVVGEFDLEHLVRGAMAVFTPIANKKGLSFGFSVDEAAKGAYDGDPTRVRQILYNLISNAVKFTPSGQVRVNVSRVDSQIVVAISDTGIGIEQDKLEDLFEKFSQVDSSATRKQGGTGLGLSIARHLIQLMGGTIKVETVAGEGSTFTAALPLPKRAEATPKPAEAAAAQVPTEPTSLRVLAAEDNEINQLVLKTLLLQAGVEVTLVENGHHAVAAWEREPWDVILMDVQMPEMDGPTATRLIREAEAKTGRKRTPIIAVTANAMTHQLGQYQAAGMDNLVPKPLEAARLFQVLESVLDSSEEELDANAAATRARA